jgi:hypothetical protein
LEDELKARFSLIFLATLIAASAGAQSAASSDKPTPSEHRAGPNGYEGWTLDSPIPDHPNETFPFTLVVARKGRVVRKIDGDPFVWQWIFWKDGREVAYESGPLHFGLQCTLMSVGSGKKLASVDCFHGIPENAPDWLKALEVTR